METRSETPRETWLQPIVALLGEGEFAEAYALAAYFPNTRNRQLVQLAALLGQNKFSEADTLLKKFAAETQSLVADFATIMSQVDLNFLETAYKAIEARYFQLADFCIQFQLLTHPETSLSVIGEGLRLRKTEFVQDINSYVKVEPTVKVPPDKLAGGEADLNRKYIGNPGYFNSNNGSINERGEFFGRLALSSLNPFRRLIAQQFNATLESNSHQDVFLNKKLS